jgi:hypothetical protein
VSPARSSAASIGAHADNEQAGAVGCLPDCSGIGNDGLAGDDSEPREAGSGYSLDGLRPDRRQVDAHFLPWLGRFDHNAATGGRANPSETPQFGNPGEHLIGAFNRFDCQHVIVGDHRRLPDIEWSNRCDQRQSACDVSPVSVGWRAAAEQAQRHQQFGRDLVCADHSEAIILKKSHQTRQQVIVAAAKHSDQLGKNPQGPEIKA